MRFIPCVLVFLICSCGGETVTVREIRNQSDKDIRMLIYNHGIAQGDTILIAKGKTRRISISTKNAADEEEPDCAKFIDSAYVEIEGGGSLLKLLQFDSNWEIEMKKVKDVPIEYEFTCYFPIRNSDIE